MAQKRTFWRRLAGRGTTALLLLPMAACAHYDYAPGPGMSAMNLGPDMARCRIFARGATPDMGFEASGSPRFVAAATAGMLVGAAIGGAIQQNQNYNDCMQARGWRVVEARPAVLAQQQPAVPVGSSAALVPVAMGAVTPVAAPMGVGPVNAISPPPAATMAGLRLPRRSLGLNVMAMTGPLAAASSLPAPEGLFVVDVLADGAAASAGLRRNDVVLAVGSSRLGSVGDLQAALAGVAHGTTVPLTIWRGGQSQVASLLF